MTETPKKEPEIKAAPKVQALTRSASAALQVFQQQADAVLSQANPVSTTLYTVLDTTKNVRITSIEARITWATTQPTPLEVIVTIDGQTFIFAITNPISATSYGAYLHESATPAGQFLGTLNAYAPYRAFLFEGRSVKIEARITWATTQPTPLVCRVRYAKIP